MRDEPLIGKGDGHVLLPLIAVHVHGYNVDPLRLDLRIVENELNRHSAGR